MGGTKSSTKETWTSLMINIVSNLWGTEPIENLRNFNHVLAFSLHEAFNKIGVESKLVHDKTYHTEILTPKADYTILISACSYVYFTPWRWKEIEKKKIAANYVSNVRKSTKKKVMIYTESNYTRYETLCDIVFTVTEPLFTPKNRRFFAHPEKYKYAGWGAKPELFYPEQKEKAVFLDSLRWGGYGGGYDNIYHTIEKVLKEAQNLRTYNPIPKFPVDIRLRWVELAKIFRKCHYYLCTQRGEPGLTRLEAATCGALIIAPKQLYVPRSISSLEHVVWDTEEDLIKALNIKTNPEKIRAKALNHTWEKVAKRIVGEF